MDQRRRLLNFLIITIIVFIIGFVAVIGIGSINMRKKVMLQFVQQTELIADLVAQSVFEVMRDGHDSERYALVRDYADIVGVEEISIFRTSGEEAFDESADARVPADEGPVFGRAASTRNPAGYFDRAATSYSQYVPLMPKGACATCHGRGGEPLGILKIRISTGASFELLDYSQKLVWTLALLVFLPLGALLVAGLVIREKNRVHDRHMEANASLQRIFNALNETRNHLQMILDNSKVVIITTDTEGLVVEFNREGEKLLKYSKEEVVGRSVLALYHKPEQRAEFIRKAMAEGGEVWAARDKEAVFRAKTGELYTMQLTLSTLVDDKGEIIGTVGVGRNVTEEKMLHFKLMQSEKLAGIGMLASGIAHEINNPLAGILGMAEAIRDENDLKTIRTYTDDIIQYAVNAGNIVRELSTYSRSARSEDLSTVDLAEVIESSVKMARHSASFSTIALDAALDKGCLVAGNHLEMQQLFVNLVINAVQAMDGDGTLAVRCFREGDAVKASVADTGCGIPEENLSKIYDPFFTTKPVGSGTGLGLYVAYRIVAKHAGSIDVESAPGVRTVFTLSFPAAAGYREDERVIERHA